MKVKDVMKSATGKPGMITVNKNESIDNAALLMRKNNLKSISVVDGKGKLVGAVTRNSILKASDDLNEDFFFD